jgi:hypothetical protein
MAPDKPARPLRGENETSETNTRTLAFYPAPA